MSPRHRASSLRRARGRLSSPRRTLTTALESGDGSLRPPEGRARSLADALPHAIRRLDLVLRGARIEPCLDTDRVSLRPMNDAEVLAVSHGAVANASLLDMRTLRPVPGGLLCPEIFGPYRDKECVCGKRYKPWLLGQACSQCGRKLVAPWQCARRLGHIELPAPVVHPWYLTGEAGIRLGNSLPVTEEELRGIVYCDLLLVTDPGSTTLHTGQLIDLEAWRPVRDQSGFTAVTGGAAVRFLLD